MKTGDSPLLARVKGFVYRKFLSRNPRLRAAARRVQFLCWRTASSFRSIFGGAVRYNPDELLWVDPQKILNCVSLEGSTYTIRGRVAGGDWDIAGLPFCGLDVYKACEDRFVRGRPWEATPYYARTLQSIERGNLPWGCNSKEDFVQRLVRCALS